MIIYNVTIKADLDISKFLKSWIIDDYLPEISKIDRVADAKLFRLLNVDVEDGITYCLQFYFEDMTNYNLFVAVDEMKFKNEILAKFSDKMILFSSLLSEE